MLRQEGSDIHTNIAASIAPGIYGYTHLKMSFVFQFFGGTALTLQDGMYLRGDFHILQAEDRYRKIPDDAVCITDRSPVCVHVCSEQFKSRSHYNSSKNSDGRWTQAGA